MEYTRKNKGVCSASTKVVIEDGIVKDVQMLGGCNGNIKGVIALVKGMKAEEAIERLSGITCGYKSTSCPDQLAITLREALGQ
ncbi:MAG: TIGR03905 family TSCPD domain-containing protein [Oscillospiraceae bacterium]|nr:TIGR03905 family TSCPD domain-containing protein [Oscillospiraceae bacterium]MBR2503604.1 TIGR03905 family TSCPD domain-containing protein [Oscillospiraceae bacterium]